MDGRLETKANAPELTDQEKSGKKFGRMMGVRGGGGVVWRLWSWANGDRGWEDSGPGLMGIGSGRTLVLRLANEEGMGRDSGLVMVKAPGASFGVHGRVRLAWRVLGLPTGVPRASVRGQDRWAPGRGRVKHQQGQMKGKGRTQVLGDVH